MLIDFIPILRPITMVSRGNPTIKNILLLHLILFRAMQIVLDIRMIENAIRIILNRGKDDFRHPQVLEIIQLFDDTLQISSPIHCHITVGGVISMTEQQFIHFIVEVLLLTFLWYISKSKIGNIVLSFPIKKPIYHNVIKNVIL